MGTTTTQQAPNTARQVIDMLRRHYLPETRPPGGIFAPEIAAPGSDRRADLIWQGVTAGFGRDLVGHEIKVTRRDVQAELADPTKSHAWMRYCDRWWLVVADPSLVDGLEIPPTWGVMAPPSGRRTRSMTVLVNAPRLNPVEQAPAYRTIATWLHWKLDEERKQHGYTRRDKDAQAHRIRDLQGELAAAGRGLHMSPLVEAVTKIVDKIGTGYGDKLGDGWRGVVEVDEVIEALQDIKAARLRAYEIEREASSLLEHLGRFSKDVDRLLQERDLTLADQLKRKAAL